MTLFAGGVGGGLYADVAGGNGTVRIENFLIVGNSAGSGAWDAFVAIVDVCCCSYLRLLGAGGGVAVVCDAIPLSVDVVGSHVANNAASGAHCLCVCNSVNVMCFSGDGGGIAISSSISTDTPLNLLYCDVQLMPPPQYRVWSSSLAVRIERSIITNNTANCSLTMCSGGGIAMTQSASYGGSIILADSVIDGNSASTFGGGLYLGGPSSGSASCSVSITDGSIVSNNSATQAGGQVYNNCGGNFSVSGSNITMRDSATEVRHHCSMNVCIVCAFVCSNRGLQ